jgi:release factor glutamine methyltransferase
MASMSSTVRDIIRSLAGNCERVGVDPELAQSYAWQLLEKVTQKTKVALLTKDVCLLTDEQAAWLNDALARLERDEPLQYILGEVVFLDLAIFVRSPLLIPRPETEAWVADLIQYCRDHGIKPQRILDIGTGTGCIALALAHEFSAAAVIATDINEEALKLVGENAQRNSISNVTCILSDVYDAISAYDTFDLIVSNPPYVCEEDWLTLSPAVTCWEDKNAIIAADAGLALIKKIIGQSHCFLSKSSVHPMLWLEIDICQGALVEQLLYDAGFKRVTIGKDSTGRDRYVWGVGHE